MPRPPSWAPCPCSRKGALRALLSFGSRGAGPFPSRCPRRPSSPGPLLCRQTSCWVSKPQPPRSVPRARQALPPGLAFRSAASSPSRCVTRRFPNLRRCRRKRFTILLQPARPVTFSTCSGEATFSSRTSTVTQKGFGGMSPPCLSLWHHPLSFLLEMTLNHSHPRHLVQTPTP